MWVVVGLGNPGRAYAATRHNVGFLLVRRLAGRYEMKLRKGKFLAKIAEGERGGERLVLARPQTFMNRSGLAVKRIIAGYEVPPERVVIVHDDLDIPLGQIRIRPDGSAGTHQGMRSVIGETGSKAFPRIRVGIGPLPEKTDAAAFVLSPFTKRELPALEGALRQADEAAGMIFAGGIQAAMNVFNRRGVT